MTIAPLQSASQVAAATRPENNARCATAPGAPTQAAVTLNAETPLLNPDPVIDASLGIVVLQYFNGGHVTQTFPSRQQLETYEIYGLKRGPPSRD